MTEPGPRPTLAEIAARTPADRDRYVDFLRAVSIVTVVLGHWAISMIWWHDGLITTSNAIGVTPGLWLATWFLQVMPIFFFVGGFSNLVTYDSFRRRGRSTGEFLRTRAARLLAPSVVFLGAWTIVQVALHLLDVGRGTGFRIWGDTWFLRGVKPPGATVPFGPLWFLPAYLLVIALAPLMLRLHRRFGVGVVIALTGASIAVDAVAFIGQLHVVRYLNILWVWLLPHQIGFFYGDGRMQRMSRRRLWGMALGGMTAMILLTNPPVFLGHGPELFHGLESYPKSLLGTENEPMVNTYPPTIVLVAMTYWVIGAAMLLRERAQAWLARSARAWMFAIWANANIMTMYLWHMTAFLLAILLLWPLGLGQEHLPTASWWWQRLVWWAVPGAILLAFIRVLGRFERPRAG